MNSIAAVSGFNFQVSSDICPIHSELKIKAGSSLICGTCAKENVIQSNLEHQKAVDAMVRKNTLKALDSQTDMQKAVSMSTSLTTMANEMPKHFA